jgi:hypothetical protein
VSTGVRSRLAVAHPSSIKDLVSVLGLMKEEPVFGSGDMNAKKEAESTEIFHCKLFVEAGNDLM